MAAYLIGGVTPVSPPTVVVGTPTTERTLNLWNGTSNDPAPAGWETLAVVDSGWNLSVVASAPSVISGSDCIWDTAAFPSTVQAVLARRTFSLPAGTVTSAVLQIWCDDTIDAAYVNGVLVLTEVPPTTGHSNPIATVSVPQSVFVPGGSNVLAIRGANVYPTDEGIAYKLTVS